jgi:hypothetical protein
VLVGSFGAGWSNQGYNREGMRKVGLMDKFKTDATRTTTGRSVGVCGEFKLSSVCEPGPDQ